MRRGRVSQANLKGRKNGWRKNEDQTRPNHYFSTSHFSAVPFFYKRVLTSVQYRVIHLMLAVTVFDPLPSTIKLTLTSPRPIKLRDSGTLT